MSLLRNGHRLTGAAGLNRCFPELLQLQHTDGSAIQSKVSFTKHMYQPCTLTLRPFPSSSIVGRAAAAAAAHGCTSCLFCRH